MKKSLAFIILCMSICITACSKNEVQVSDKENGMIAEYIAGTLLKYDKNYKEKLVIKTDIDNKENAENKDNTIEAAPKNEDQGNVTEEGTPSKITEISTNTESDKQEYIELTELLKSPDFDISYKNFGLYESYPKHASDPSFILESKKGAKLLILEFNIKNLSNKKKKLNLVDKDLLYELNINNTFVYKPEITLLTNDLQYMNLEMDDNKDQKAVLVFEIDDKIKVEKMDLYISSGDKTAKVIIR